MVRISICKYLGYDQKYSYQLQLHYEMHANMLVNMIKYLLLFKAQHGLLKKKGNFITCKLNHSRLVTWKLNKY